MKIAITGFRDRLLMIGIALLLCVFLVGSFFFADEYHINENWLLFAWVSFMAIAIFARAFRGHLRRPRMVPFLTVLTVVHGIVCFALINWQVPILYWLPIFIVEFSLGAWAAYRFFGVIPSGDI